MKLSTLLVPTLLSLLALGGTAQAQINKAPASPLAKLTQVVGMSQVNLEYSRPGVKGRKIFGGLETFGNVWRTGANASTKITFDRNVVVEGNEVPKGTYAIYTIPEKENWTFILSKQTELWGASGYDPAKDLMRVQIPVYPQEHLTETFTIDFSKFHSNGADLTLTWEHTQVKVGIFIDSDAMVFEEITEKVKNAKGEISARTYFDAATFYIEKGRDLPQAEKWIDKAVEMSPEAFWMMYAQASLAHDMGNTEKATKCAQKALKTATESKRGDFGYISKCNTLLGKIAGKKDEAKQ